MIDLKAWRTGHGMTQQQAADALGIGNSTVRAIEAGTREMTGTLVLACHGFDALATPAPDDHDLPDEQPADDSGPAWQDSVDAICARLAAAERGVRVAIQSVHEMAAAIEEAGLPLRQALIPMTDEEREEAELRLYKAQLIDQMQRAAKAAPGALTDDERTEAERARRMIAKARTLAAGEPWD